MNADVDVRVDRKIGDFFLPRLRDAKQRLWIMSPWVAAEYMELAVSKKTAGVDVKVITSNDYVSGQKEALRKLVENKTRILKPENRNMKYIGLGLVIAGIIFASATKGLSLLGSVVGVVLYLVGREKSETYWISKLGDGNLKVLEYHPYKVVHAKIYIVDDMVIMGSANLTGNGIRNNIEGMATMQSPELATKLMGMMSGIERTLGLRTVSYDTVGRDIQHIEPRRRFYGKQRYSDRASPLF